MSNNPMEFLPQIHQKITELDTEISLDQENTLKIRRKTLFYMKVTLIIFITFIILLLLEGFTLSKNIQSLGDDMVLMYEQFGEMSDEMHEMSGNVSKMETNVQTIPVMAYEMGLMVTSMQLMHKNMTQMKSDVIIMEGNLNQITGGMNEMNSRFSHLNNTVNYIDYNVHEMSKVIP